MLSYGETARRLINIGPVGRVCGLSGTKSIPYMPAHLVRLDKLSTADHRGDTLSNELCLAADSIGDGLLGDRFVGTNERADAPFKVYPFRLF